MAFGLEFRSASSHPFIVCTTGASLENVSWQSEGGYCRDKSLTCCPSSYSYFVPSLFKIRMCETGTWAMLCLLRCPSQIKLRLCYSTPCLLVGCFQSIDFVARAPVYLRGPGMLTQAWCGHQNWCFCPGVSSWCREKLVMEEVLVLLLTISFAFW